MNKSLPKPKKTLKTFILENDAKITDKTAAKVAITISFIGISLTLNSQDANAKGHKNHTNHSNDLNVNHDLTQPPANYHVGNNFHEEDVVISEIPGKDVQTAHANHYNHKDGGGQGGCSGGFQDSPTSGSTPSIDGSKAIMPANEIQKLKTSETDWKTE